LLIILGFVRCFGAVVVFMLACWMAIVYSNESNRSIMSLFSYVASVFVALDLSVRAIKQSTNTQTRLTRGRGSALVGRQSLFFSLTNKAFKSRLDDLTGQKANWWGMWRNT
jgi:uncharacterized membrane protein required for colicin V production